MGGPGDLADLLDLPTSHPETGEPRQVGDAQDAPPTGADAAVPPPTAQSCHGCRRPAPHRCVSCSHAFCAAHFRVMLGLCTGCGGEKGAGAGKEPRDLAAELGIKWLR